MLENLRNYPSLLDIEVHVKLSSKTVPSPDQEFTVPKGKRSKKINIFDLARQINQLCKEKHEVLVMLDANELIGKINDGVSRLIQACNLQDLCQQHANPPAIWENRIINFMFGTAGVYKAMQASGYAALNNCIFSIFIFANLDFKQCIEHYHVQ